MLKVGKDRKESIHRKLKGYDLDSPAWYGGCTLTIPAIQEAEAGGLQVQGQDEHLNKILVGKDEWGKGRQAAQ